MKKWKNEDQYELLTIDEKKYIKEWNGKLDMAAEICIQNNLLCYIHEDGTFAIYGENYHKYASIDAFLQKWMHTLKLKNCC